MNLDQQICTNQLIMQFHICSDFGKFRQLWLIVSTGSIRWILWFSVRYAAAAHREIFGVNALRGKRQRLGSPNLQDIFIGGKLLWEGK